MQASKIIALLSSTNFWRNLFFASLCVLVLTIAYRIAVPRYQQFGSAQHGYYRLDRFTGTVHRITPHGAFPVPFR